MKALSVALKTDFDANGGTFKAAVSNQLYPDRAPSRATYPYASYTVVDGRPDWTFTEDEESFLLQVSIFSESASKAEALDTYEKLKTWLDDNATIAVAGWNILRIQRGAYREIWDSESGTWHIPAEYTIEMEREKP